MSRSLAVKTYWRMNLLQLGTVSLYSLAALVVAIVARQTYGQPFVQWLGTTQSSALILFGAAIFLAAACLAPSRKSVFFRDAMLPLKTAILAGCLLPTITVGEQVLSPLVYALSRVLA